MIFINVLASSEIISWQQDQDYTYAASWIDFNNDGLPDLVDAPHWIQRGPDQLKIYINDGDGTFTDIAPHVQTDYNEVNTDNHGMAWADFDNDGDQDVAFNSGGPTASVFYVNEGGRLVERAAQLGVDGVIGDRNSEIHSHGLRGRASTWVDVNRDGRLDLINSNWVFTPAYMSSPIVRELARRGLDQTALYIQQGNGQFAQRVDFAGEPIYSAKVNPGDLLTDNVLDLVFAEDYRERVAVYTSSRNYAFQKRSNLLPSEVENPRNSIVIADVAIADFDGDLRPEILTIPQNIGSNPGSPMLLTYDPGTRTYVDRSQSAGLSTPVYGQGLVTADFDNDGHLDIFITTLEVNGNRKRPNNGILYRNRGNGTFQRVADNAGLNPNSVGNQWAQGALTGLTGGVQRVFTADYDLNGFMDVYTTNILGGSESQGGNSGNNQQITPAYLFSNGGNNNNWLQIDLRGVRSNEDALGAKVYLTTPDNRTQYRELYTNQGFGQNSSRIHFGLGRNNSATQVRIVWPSGGEETITNISANQIVQVVESRGIQGTFRVGNNSNNTINGTNADDTLAGQGGNDLLSGSGADDALNGGSGNDTLNAGSGNDRLHGSSGNDLLQGEQGNDHLTGGDGNDNLNGGNGNDTLLGGSGSDVLTGGAGGDQFVFYNPVDGPDIISDFTSEQDRLIISRVGFSNPSGLRYSLSVGTLPAEQFLLGSANSNARPGTFIYDQSNGNLFFESFSNSPSRRVLLATLTSGPTLSNQSIIVDL